MFRIEKSLATTTPNLPPLDSLSEWGRDSVRALLFLFLGREIGLMRRHISKIGG